MENTLQVVSLTILMGSLVKTEGGVFEVSWDMNDDKIAVCYADTCSFHVYHAKNDVATLVSAGAHANWTNGLKLPIQAGYLVHNGFALLDVMGPSQVLDFPGIKDLINVTYIGVDHDVGSKLYKASESVNFLVNYGLIDAPHQLDLLIFPGGGVRPAGNSTIVSWVTERIASTKAQFSICTGASLLAATGALDGKKATTNKVAFSKVAAFGPKVNWQKKARWVIDGNIITTSGVAAGIDGAFVLVELLGGKIRADALGNFLEIIRATNSRDDPFSKFLDSTTLIQ
ncbi:hypothetical protein HK096_010680, partial [Nowakowskiella sp. JEL0078]